MKPDGMAEKRGVLKLSLYDYTNALRYQLCGASQTIDCVPISR
jgi:hypothetical protein